MKAEILALYQLTEALALDLAGKDILMTSRRELAALELITEAHQCLFAACVNLDLVASGDDRNG